jgi:hypothetical protein
MKMLELLNDHPKSAIVVKQWMLNKLIDSLKDESLPEDFKEIVRKQGIDNDKVANMISGSPRSAFDVFDDHKVYVETIVDELGGFWWNIGEIKSTVGYEYRKNCDEAAIIEAFKLLEEKL